NNPIGQYLQVKLGTSHVSLRVVGVLDQVTMSKMSLDIADPNGSSFMPLSSLESSVLPEPVINLVIKPDSVDRIPAYHNIIKNMYQSSSSEYASISDVVQAAEKVRTDVNGIFLAGLIVGILSLINGGVGIMNIMLVSIMQRKKEIGLYKTFGYSKGLITMQFTAEALFISLLGAIAGVIVGIPLAGQISMLILKENLGADPFAVFVGFSFTVLIGLIFGIIPARRAAELDPVSSIKGT
ncbi:MAG: FtsX-like permease family protein, partial [Bdellovibrionales bacterium]|nr:FtsX-like permease family protein [Bdellovibrionales bacterium]